MEGSARYGNVAILQEHLLTDDQARLFAEEFDREMRRLGQRERCDQNAAEGRVKQLETELANLYQNLLAGLASPALQLDYCRSGGGEGTAGKQLRRACPEEQHGFCCSPSAWRAAEAVPREGGGSASIAR